MSYPGLMRQSLLKSKARFLFIGIFLLQGMMMFSFAAEQTHPQSVSSYLEQGIQALKRNEKSEALKFFRKAKALDPKFAPAYVGEAEVLTIQNAWDEALALLNRAIQLAPEYGVAYHNRGILQYYRKDYPKAYLDFKQAAQFGETVDHDILTQVWGATFPDEMIERMNVQISANSKDADAYLNRGIAHFYRKAWQATLSDWKKAQQLGAIVDPIMWKELEREIQAIKKDAVPSH